jgi:hypothetical protein
MQHQKYPQARETNAEFIPPKLGSLLNTDSHQIYESRPTQQIALCMKKVERACGSSDHGSGGQGAALHSERVTV